MNEFLACAWLSLPWLILGFVGGTVFTCAVFVTLAVIRHGF